MPRGMENYICASEDFSHYDSEIDFRYGSPYMRAPEITIIQPIIKREEVSKEKLDELIKARIPDIKDAIIDELGDIITSPDLDAAIDEIYGGSAEDAVKEDDD